MLTYSKIKKSWRHFLSSSVHPSIRTLKVFPRDFSANYRRKIETIVFVIYTELIKIKRNQLDPSGNAFALSLWGKGFLDFLKVKYSSVFFDDRGFAPQSHIKWKKCQVGILGYWFHSSLLGDKSLYTFGFYVYMFFTC